MGASLCVVGVRSETYILLKKMPTTIIPANRSPVAPRLPIVRLDALGVGELGEFMGLNNYFGAAVDTLNGVQLTI